MKEERIDALEIRITYLENFLNQLNDIVLENGHQIATMIKDQKSLIQQINELSNESPKPEAEKPPHY